MVVPTCLLCCQTFFFPEGDFRAAAEEWYNKKTGGMYSRVPVYYTYSNAPCSSGDLGTFFGSASHHTKYNSQGITFNATYGTR